MGGILIIDHRNYDYILKHGKSPNKNIYYNSSIYKVVTKTIYEDGKAKQIILDYKEGRRGWKLPSPRPALQAVRILFPSQGSFWNPTATSNPQGVWRLQGVEGQPRPCLLHPHDREAPAESWSLKWLLSWSGTEVADICWIQRRNQCVTEACLSRKHCGK